MSGHSIFLLENGVIPLQGLEDGMAAYAAASNWFSQRTRLLNERVQPLRWLPQRQEAESRWLDEGQSKTLLGNFGLGLPAREIVELDAVGDAASRIGFPVVVKAVGPEFLHKSELNAVHVGIKDHESATRAAQAIADSTSQAGKPARRFLVEGMVTDAVAELIVGIKRDPQFGPALVLGSGGVLVELLHDSASLLLPASPEQVREALSSLKVMTLIQGSDGSGFRGRPPGDLEACIQAICCVAEFAEAHWESLLELDINPLMVRPDGKGVMAADALIRLESLSGKP